MAEKNNVIDIMEYRLVKKIREAETPLEEDVADALLSMYREGLVQAMVIDGEVMFQSLEVFGSDEPVFVPTSHTGVSL